MVRKQAEGRMGAPKVTLLIKAKPEFKPGLVSLQTDMYNNTLRWPMDVFRFSGAALQSTCAPESLPGLLCLRPALTPLLLVLCLQKTPSASVQRVSSSSQLPEAATVVQSTLLLREALEAGAHGLWTGHSVLHRFSFSVVGMLQTFSCTFFHRQPLKDFGVTPLLPEAGDPYH